MEVTTLTASFINDFPALCGFVSVGLLLGCLTWVVCKTIDTCIGLLKS